MRNILRVKHCIRFTPCHLTQPTTPKMPSTHIYLSPVISQHFWHFFMGEFLPVVAYVLLQEKSSPNAKANAVSPPLFRTSYIVHKADIDSPFNAFYRELGIQVVHTSDEQCKTHLTKDIRRWDGQHPQGVPPNDRGRARCAVDWLCRWASTTPTQPLPQSLSHRSRRSRRQRRTNQSNVPSSPTSIVVQIRKDQPQHTHYFQHQQHHLPKNTALHHKRKTYGAQRRSVPNLGTEVADALRERFVPTPPTSHTSTPSLTSPTLPHLSVVWDDGKSLREQIQQYHNADVLVLGHGAGMVHALWLRPGAVVVEIVPREKMRLMKTTVQRTNTPTRQCQRRVTNPRGCWEVDGLSVLNQIVSVPLTIQRITVNTAHSKVSPKTVVRSVQSAYSPPHRHTKHASYNRLSRKRRRR